MCVLCMRIYGGIFKNNNSEIVDCRYDIFADRRNTHKKTSFILYIYFRTCTAC